MYDFNNIKEVREITKAWIRHYNKETLHQALGYSSPDALYYGLQCPAINDNSGVQDMGSISVLAFVCISQVDLEGLIKNTDFILRHLKVKATVGSLQELYRLYESLSEQLGNGCQFWIEGIKKSINALIAGASFSDSRSAFRT